jgi:nucleotide-binding universal stress UspA family protein
MVVIAVLFAWLVVGVAVGLIEARRGGWHKGWVISALLGPLAIPYELQAYRRGATVTPVTLEAGKRGVGLSVLVGVDGSDSSRVAGLTTVKLFSDRIGRLTLAAVLDFDTAASPVPSRSDPEGDWPERIQAKAALARLADEISAEIGERPGTVLLAGEPAEALEAFAADDGQDLLVVGTRGHGMSKILLGSCASRLGHQHNGVPVLLVPTPSVP